MYILLYFIILQLHGLQTTMVYADVAVSSKSSMPTALDLDDSHVAYAQIEHKLHKDKMVKPPALPMIDESDPTHGTRGRS